MEESRRLSLPEVTATGDRRASLEALRQTLAKAVEDCDSYRDLAALSRQLASVLTELDNLPAAKGASSFDELRSRRARNGSAASAG